MKSWDSPASKGASQGPGPEGAGELPAVGPGPAAKRKAGMVKSDNYSKASAKASSGKAMDY